MTTVRQAVLAAARPGAARRARPATATCMRVPRGRASRARPTTGTYDPGTDRYFLIGAIEQHYPRDIGRYLDAGDNVLGLFDHYWFNTATSSSTTGSAPIPTGRVQRAVHGAKRRRRCSRSRRPTTRRRRTAAQGAAKQLGNVRLLTMAATATRPTDGSSACIDEAVVAHIETLALPAKGTVCTQACRSCSRRRRPRRARRTVPLAGTSRLVRKSILRLHAHR